MRLADARVVERREVGANLFLLWLSAPDISRGARPGQFVMVRCGDGLDPFLARPFWIHRIRAGDDGEQFALLVEVVGRGTRWLARTVPGQELCVWGPLGRPLTLAPGVRNLLLLAYGVSVAPLVWCADDETERGRSVTLVLGAPTAAQLYPVELLKPEVELSLTTDDGTSGRDESVADLIEEHAGWADQIIACGPTELYRSIAGVLRMLLWRRPCRVLLQPPMPCGTGVCAGCWVPARRRGMKLACREGPAFDLRELF